MFNLSEFQKRHQTNVLEFIDAAYSKQLYSYADLYIQSIELSTNIQNNFINIESSSTYSLQYVNIAIILPVHSPAILPIVVGIENAGCVSCFLNPSEDFESLKKQLFKLQTNIILCDANNFNKFNAVDKQIQQICSCTLFDTECVLIRLNNLTCKSNLNSTIDNCHDTIKSSKIFFYASTSGSCGENKLIGVTYKCFMPNITSLGKLYGVTNNDTIFVTSPPTFDPFMVDVCLALHYGASLVMVDHKLRCDAKKLLDILFSHKQHSNITIMQMTPSLFMHWTSDDIKHRIFSSISKLRILALGGERFPTTNLLRKWMNWEILSTDSMCRVFNLYGLTEMSCWAGVYELTKDDILENRTIPIGQPIDEYTAFQVSADGELLLKSTVRKCFQLQLTDEQVTDNQFEFILHTGDLVDFENGTFYFTSRTNSIVKFYGQKINLSEIEQCAKNVDKVEDVACFHDENHNSIVLFVKTNEHIHTMKEQIQKALRKVNVYVKVYFVTEFPLTMHGKICENDLLNLVVECNNETVSTLESIQSIFLKLINESIGTTIQALDIESQQTSKKLKMECDSSFIELGGSSLKAIQIVNELESITSQTNTFLLLMLLDEKVSIREILSKLSNEKLSIQSSVSNQSTNSSPIIPEINPFWKINMEKCIDATPTVCKLRNGDVIVSVGSHSKLLYNIFLATGEIISKLEFPDRIESQVVQMDDDGIVGCYDGHLYCFDIRTGTIKWKSDSGAMIKCRALLMDSLILFGNYNESHNFWCLNTSNGLLKYCLKIGLKSIYANPVKINDENCLVCSLDGTVAQVNSFTAQILWMFDAKAPIFSTPTIFLNSLNEQQIILATVNGIIYLLTIDGICTSDHQIDGNIFSSFEYFPNFEVSETCIDFIIGSQNRFLYCISIDKMGICSEAWRILTSASIRSNPVFIRKNQNWLAAIFSSDGVVNVIDCDNGKLIQQNRIDGDVFSSPVIYDERLIVGSRNNFLYCIGLNSLIGNKSVFDGS